MKKNVRAICGRQYMCMYVESSRNDAQDKNLWMDYLDLLDKRMLSHGIVKMSTCRNSYVWKKEPNRTLCACYTRSS